MSDKQKALAWTEALTLIADNHVPDEVYDQARKQFSEQELATLRLRWSQSTLGTASLSVFAKSLGRINKPRVDKP